jgi:hypothetical protein
VIIGNLYHVRITDAPDKANTILVVYANAMLTLAIAGQFFEPVSWWNSQVFNPRRGVQHGQLSERHCGGRRSSRLPGTPNPFGIGIGEALDHKGIITLSVINGNR